MRIVHWRRLRQGVQAFSLLLSLVLVAYTLRDARGALAADDLLRLDPLVGAAAMLSTRHWLARFVPALVLLGATLALGRFWCGWLCPLGTLIDWISPRSRRGRALAPRWRGVKYGLLFVILFAALWGNLTLLILDPLTIFVRTLASVILPGLNWLIGQAEIALYNVPFLRGAIEVADSALRGPILAYEQPYYGGAVLIAALFGGILALNLIARRAWCRYFCPLGGLLSLISRASWLKRTRSGDCAYCGACEEDCRMGTIDINKNRASDSGECILCLDCAVACQQTAISFGRALWVDRGWAYDPTRRQALAALGVSLAGLALLKIAPGAHHPRPHRLRPPGAEEEALLSSCIRCGVCIRVCPTHGLQPSLTQSGPEGLWTPVLVPRLGECDYSCTECGSLCPTGAIPQLPPAQKRQTVIGKARIDPTVCIAWAAGWDCIVCEEMCPLPDKAIILQEKAFEDERGPWRTVMVPVVLYDRCIGCGLCENKCPVNGEAAIRVIVDPMS